MRPASSRLFVTTASGTSASPSASSSGSAPGNGTRLRHVHGLVALQVVHVDRVRLVAVQAEHVVEHHRQRRPDVLEQQRLVDCVSVRVDRLQHATDHQRLGVRERAVEVENDRPIARPHGKRMRQSSEPGLSRSQTASLPLTKTLTLSAGPGIVQSRAEGRSASAAASRISSSSASASTFRMSAALLILSGSVGATMSAE